MIMKNDPLIVRYRPKNFSEFRGNENVVLGLSLLLKKEGKPHSYLFIGPSGSGKTTLARIVARELSCEPTEFYEYNAANTRGIDTIREIIQNAHYEPLWGAVKVFLLDEAHQITGAAAEALLKFLEDPPKHVYTILCTTEPQKLITTVKNRCSVWSVAPLSETQLISHMNWVLKQENKVVDPQVVESVAIVAEGCPRKALSILDQVIEVPDKMMQLKIILDCSVDEVTISAVGEMLLDPSKSWSKEVAPFVIKLIKSENEDEKVQVEESKDKKLEIGRAHV